MICVRAVKKGKRMVERLQVGRRNILKYLTDNIVECSEHGKVKAWNYCYARGAAVMVCPSCLENDLGGFKMAVERKINPAYVEPDKRILIDDAVTVSCSTVKCGEDAMILCCDCHTPCCHLHSDLKGVRCLTCELTKTPTMMVN